MNPGLMEASLAQKLAFGSMLNITTLRRGFGDAVQMLN
jgi:hypothetical protein